MAISKTLMASLLISLLLMHLAKANQVKNNVAQDSLPTKIDCGGACAARCQLSSRPNLCKRACGTCCARCSCVPPGTSGNLEVCPCYANMTTHGNRRKCP
ncbi:snakin-2-like isoform X2 [Corylus avellana]|uniref:snakin-2-like isoform X2 n=1 Tax=Corylus avellana TaxID=13451 RepID=UPI00286D49EE|nr:snakin-2-like isoform X2 [Corylus avellana]